MKKPSKCCKSSSKEHSDHCRVMLPLEGKVKTIDLCLHHIIAALNAAGVYTLGCCCGHGTHVGSILLADGTVLEYYQSRAAWEKHRKKNPATLSQRRTGRI